jgi:hypothetical protein
MTVDDFRQSLTTQPNRLRNSRSPSCLRGFERFRPAQLTSDKDRTGIARITGFRPVPLTQRST